MSINISEYIDDLGNVNTKILKNDVRHIVDYGDTLIDINLKLLPLDIQKEQSKKFRQIGIGVMGVADAFIKAKVKYGSQESIDLIEEVMHTITQSAYKRSAERAIEISPCEAYINQDFDWRDTEFAKNVLQNAFDEHTKFRNSHLITIAPNGGTSNFMNTSGGIEPLFDFQFERKVPFMGADCSYTIRPSAIENEMERTGCKNIDKLSNYCVRAHDIPWIERLKVQAAAQKYVDNAISSTINLPKSAKIEEIEEIIMAAWKLGIKGITVFRDGCDRQGVLTTEKTEKDDEKIEQKYDYISPIDKVNFEETYGTNVKRKVACGNLYINVCRDINGNIVETFLNTGKGGICQSNINAISRLLSLSLRSGVKVEEIVDQLLNIRCPACTAMKAKGENVGKSCPDVIASYLLDQYKNNNMIIKERKPKVKKQNKNLCPDCQAELRAEGGCVICSCGFSKCD